jgi:hypothetical protein
MQTGASNSNTANSIPFAFLQSASVRKWAKILTILIMALIIAPIPLAPLPLGEDVDSSTSAVLNFAQAKGLQHGTDIVFTYGPLGFLTFFYYSPHLPGLRMTFDVLLAGTVAAGLCFVAWRMSIIWRCLFIAVIAWIGANAWYREDWVIYCGLLSWSLLCFVETGWRLTMATVIMVALGVLLGLAKISTLILTATGIIIIGFDLVARRHVRLAIGAWVGFVVGFLLGWALLGQELTHLARFLSRSRDIVSGYGAAVGLEGLQSVRFSGLLLVLPWLVMILLRVSTAFEGDSMRLYTRRFCLATWLLFFAFTSWKHGWVRVDQFHVVMFFGLVPILALALESLPSKLRWATLTGRVLGIGGGLIAVFALQMYFFQPLPRPLFAPATALYEHARWILFPGTYRAAMESAIERNRQSALLPGIHEIVGNASVDVFGQPAGYAIFNGLNYRPRPVFQSYVTFNAALMDLNEQFYRSSAAPEFVLFSLGAMDKRLPALEDAPLLRYLLINYQPVATAGEFLVLKSGDSEAARMTLLKQGTVAPGERIDLGLFANDNLWLDIKLTSNTAGRLFQFLYRPSTVRLAVWTQDTLLIRHRAPVSMMEAGFLASPLLVSTANVSNLYTNGPITRPTAYSVELPVGEEDRWNSKISYRIYRIENGLGSSATR